MKKQRVRPLSNARKLMCCTTSGETGAYYKRVKCFTCSDDTREDDDDGGDEVEQDQEGKRTTKRTEHHHMQQQDALHQILPKTSSKIRKKRSTATTSMSESAAEKEAARADICLLRESPFRILRVAESGNVREFQRLITTDLSKLNVRDGRGRAAVHQATIRNHVPILQVVVAFNGNLNLTDNHENTPLHLAVEFETLDTLEFLLANQADTKKLNNKYQSALHLACELNKTEALRVLAKYKNKLDPNIAGEHGRTPLHLAAINDHDECLKILLYEIGACPKKSDLFGNFIIHEAAKHASSKSMEILLAWGDRNGCPRSEMISFFDAEGNVPLHSAVHGGDIRAVELCLRSGAKISTQQHDLSTPVHLACSQGAMDMVKLMFTLQPEEKDVCLKSCDMQRMTPLHCAAMFDHHELVEYLVSEGATVDVLDKERRSPLIIAASRNAWRTMKVLIRLGANVSLKDNDSRSVLHVLVIHGGDLEKILDDEFQKDFLPILDEKDKYGYTPLHYAAKQGHMKSASKLLKLGASIITKNNDGENVFHIACRYGRLNIIQQILGMEQNNSVINEGNGKGLTALHIAAREGHVRVVQILMKKGVLLHRDYSGETPLHLAAKNGHKDTMRVILNVHSHLLDQTDKDGNTCLHVAAMENRPGAVDLLLSLNCQLTTNLKGYTAMDFALQNKFAGVALVMVTHPTRGDEILAMTSGKYSSIMLALVATMPQVVQAVLDRCITKSDNKTDSELYHIKYDFKWLSLVDSSGSSIGNSINDQAELMKPDGKTDRKHVPEKKHLPVLNGMVSNGRVDLLSHDLSQKYLQMKWNAYGKYIHIAHLFLYLFYLTIVTVYTSSPTCSREYGYGKDNDDSTPASGSFRDRRNWTAGSAAVNFESMMRANGSTEKYTSPAQEDCYDGFALELVILIAAILNVSREIANAYRQRIKYLLDSSNWVFWIMTIASIVMVSRIFPSNLVEPSMSLAAFLSWFYLLLFLQRFDVVGIYVVMFLEILHTLLRVLMIFSILIVAFGLAFFILLSKGNHVAFEAVPMSLMRTFSMMLGDLDFMNTFVNPYHCDHQNLTNIEIPKECELKRELPHPGMSFLMVVIFIVLMPILLMNLLIGLAVGDIESVRRNAQLKRLAMQVHLHTALEKTLPKFILARVDKKEVVEFPNISTTRLGFIDYLFKCFQPKSTATMGGTVRIMEAAEDEVDDLVASIQQNKSTLASLSSRLENIETLIRLLCQKMELCTEMDCMDEGIQLDHGTQNSDGSESGTSIERSSRLRARRKTPRRCDSSIV